MRLALSRVLAPVLFGVIPAVVMSAALAWYWRTSQFAVDFHHGLYVQANQFLSTGTPFDPPDAVIVGNNRVGTLFTTFFVAPFTLLPPLWADVVMTGLVLAAGVATLWVLDVRDWRVYGVVGLWSPIISAVQTANLTLFLGLLIALAWRYRQRYALSGLFVGLAIAVKLFPWPLVIWLVGTRRYAAAVTAVVVALTSFVLILPFADPLDYFTLLHRLSDSMGVGTYSLYGTTTLSRVVWIALIGLVLLSAARLDDRKSFTLAVAACFLVSPIVWLHYFSLLMVPLAIARPRLSAIWFLPLGNWGLSVAPGSDWQLARAIAITGAIVGILLIEAFDGSGETPVSRGVRPSARAAF